MKDEVIKSKEESLKAAEERLSAESARKVSELKKKAEQKIAQIKKQLTSQLEEKEQTIKALQIQPGGDQEQRNEEQEKQLEEILSNERLEKEKSLEELKNMYEEKLSSLQRDVAQQEELQETESKLHEIEAKLKGAEEQNENLLEEINRLKEEMSTKDAQLGQHQGAIKQVQNLSQPEGEMMVECSSVQQTKSAMENHSQMEELDGDSHESLKNSLSQMKNEKEKLQKDFTRLQKDIRLLRKEHEQDLEYMKKELLEENEKKLKLELEDAEMKHNSAIKQLMREFNTQMALKETELDSSVKETIAKALSVEEELISSHREEASQLRKLIAQKEDDLHRTVQKYEQVIQSREEEMGGRVWQVQKELEELKGRSQGTSEAQLAEKTTLLSEARLKEQGFVERIHSLEDKIKCFHRTTVVTHLGSTFKDPGFNSTDALSEATEMEYLRKVLFEYMMGRETKTMAKVITSMLKFPPDQAQKVLDKEDSKTTLGLRRANSTYSSSIHSPGAVYKCRVHSNPGRRCTEMDLGRGNKQRESCGKTCQGDRDDEWMGVSLARQDRANGQILWVVRELVAIQDSLQATGGLDNSWNTHHRLVPTAGKMSTTTQSTSFHMDTAPSFPPPFRAGRNRSSLVMKPSTIIAKLYICFCPLIGVLALKISSRRALKCDISPSVQHEYFGKSQLSYH
ncbi:Golgin subfamily A member 4 256 kDa golgin [Collichthys lucidus]|uniref:Golgin subfamily A member 4 256 kDa golgin n=1 Tax=Collichthys lucidus TaxID=240159 RepID=A0A4U5VCX2_COLLU|nr:Golgin subfamily A member 4 256 kDa golgin [Collichthys lucidus]